MFHSQLLNHRSVIAVRWPPHLWEMLPIEVSTCQVSPRYPHGFVGRGAAGFCLPAAMRKNPSPRDAKPAKGSVHITPRRGWILVPRFGQRKLVGLYLKFFTNHILHSHVENTKQIPIRNRVSREDELILPSIPNTSTKPHHLPTYCVSVEGLVIPELIWADTFSARGYLLG